MVSVSKLSLFSIWLLCMLIGFNACFAKNITIGIHHGASVQSSFYPLYKKFEQQTGIKITRYPIIDMKQLDNNQVWETDKGITIDIIHGNVSERLALYQKQNKLYDLSSLWKEQEWDTQFGHLKELVSYNNSIVGLPYEVIGWHIFYKPSLLSNYGGQPKTFKQLKQLCIALNKNNIIPFHIYEKQAWTAMAWFEYILLRQHGLAFFNQVTSGKISYYDERITATLKRWQELVQAGCFKESFGSMNWHDSLPYFFRNKIAMIFTGSFLIPNVKNENAFQDLDFSPFPTISDIPRFESAPIDLYLVNKSSKNIDDVNQFLIFLSQSEVQTQIANSQKSIPANIHSSIKQHPLSIKLQNHLAEAAGFSPFFDRATPPKFEKESRQHFIDFIRHANIDKFQRELEQLRQELYVTIM